MFNNKTKMFLIFTLVCITIIGISTISAAEIDNNATDTPSIVKTANSQNVDATTHQTSTKNANTKNKEITKKINENKKSENDGTFADLSKDINSSEVKLTKNYVQGELESNITISEDKVIDADGYTLTTHNGTFVVNSGVKFTLKNAIIQSTYAPNMPSPQPYYYDIDNRGTVTLENVTFQYTGTERTYGAPVYSYANSNLTVIGSTFEGYDTPRALIYANGARITVNVDNSLFTNYYTANTAIYMGSANNNLTVRNTNFTNGGRESGNGINYGGGLYLNNYQQNVLVENCVFDNITTGTRAAGIYTSGNTTVRNSVFKNLKQTSATNNGGAIWSNNGNGILCLENNTMENIQSNSANIYFNNGKINSTVLIKSQNYTVDQEDSVDLKIDLTDDNGNSIDFKTSPLNMTLNGETYTLPMANGSATKTIEATMDPGVYNITINCDTTNILSPINIPKVTLTVNDIGLVKYTNVSKLIDEAEAGSIVSINSLVARSSAEDSIVIDKAITLDFNGNTINAKKGRVFDITENADVTIKNAVITNVGNPSTDSSNTEGRIAKVFGKVKFENVLFENNTAPNFYSSASGSFILAYDTGSSVELEDCIINNCTGAFINNVESNVKINNSRFTNNNLGSSYNAFIANGGLLTINNSLFKSNTVNLATIHGKSNKLASSAYTKDSMYTNKPLIITNTSFIDNYAGNGRGAAVNTQNNTNITDSIFIFNRINQANNMGGAILSEEGDLLIDRCVFVNNSARVATSIWDDETTYNNGTAIYNAEGGLIIRNSIIISNITEASAVQNGASNAIVTANNNYWGTDNPTGRYVSDASADPIIVNTWVQPYMEVSPREVAFHDNVSIKVAFITTDGENASTTDALPDYGVVTFTAEGGDLKDNEVAVTDGQASTSMTVKLNPFTIKATYPNKELEYTGEATMPEPSVYELNDGNWTNFFNDDGTVKDNIIPYSQLEFIGTFTNRNMIINIPLNITTSAQEQAVFNNCTFTVKAGQTSIKNIQMNSKDTSEYLILVDGLEDVRIANNILTLTNTNETGYITHTIDLVEASKITIQNNIITTDGPEKDVEYSSDSEDADIDTVSINALNCKEVLIDSNTITTKSNGEATSYGTIYSIYLCGRYEEERTFESTYVTNNVIDTQAQKYGYGIYIGNHAYGVTVNGNEFSSHDSHYANAIYTKLSSDLIMNNNTINIANANISYGIVITSPAYDPDYYFPICVENIAILNNKINMNSLYDNAIQLMHVENVEIYGNNITLDDDYGLGISSVILRDAEIYDNNFTITSTMQTEGPSYDTYFTTAGGISISGNPMGASEDNNIYNNTIIVSAANDTISAVKIEAGVRSNSITDNYLVSPYGLGNDAVLNNGQSNTIADNLPVRDKTVIIIADPAVVSIFEDKNATITLSLNNATEEPVTQGTIKIYVDNELIKELNVESDVLEFTVSGYEAGSHTITVNYTTPNERLYNNSTLNIDYNVKGISKVNTTTENVTLGETTTLSAAFYNDEGLPITDGKVMFRVNGKTLRYENGTVITVDITNGKAELPNVAINGEWMKEGTIIQAVFCGNDEYEPVMTKVSTVNVVKPTVNVIIPSKIEANPGDNVTLSASVSSNNQTVNTGRVAFKLNGKTLKDENGKALYANVKNGVATRIYEIPTKTKSKIYTLTAVFTDNFYDRCSDEEDFIVKE